MYTEFLSYQDGSQELEGFIAYDEFATGCKPLVLVAHAWRGRDEFACQKASELATLGYVGFALDLYGKGVLGRTTEENSQLMQPFLDDRTLLKRRMQLALDIAKKQPIVDQQRIAAIGFCFGGLCALDLARSGADIGGVVSFHGLLFKPPQVNEKINAKILALHGYQDPMVSFEQVREFTEEMENADVDWQMHVYGHTMHAFTNPLANDPNFGTVYDSKADQRSWQAMKNFLVEIFGQ